MRSLEAFFNDDTAATAIEYALISSLIAVTIASVVGSLGTRLSGTFSEVSSALQ